MHTKLQGYESGTIILLIILLVLLLLLIRSFCNYAEDYLQDEDFPILSRRPCTTDTLTEKQCLDQLEILVTRIQKDILEQAGIETTKADLLLDIHAAVASFGGLSHPAYQNALSHYIIQQTKRGIGPVVNHKDMEQFWATTVRLR
jgi:hypothetical protein